MRIANLGVQAVAVELVAASTKIEASVDALRAHEYDRLLGVARGLRTTVAKARVHHAEALGDFVRQQAEPRAILRDAAMLEALRSTVATYHDVSAKLIHLAVKNA